MIGNPQKPRKSNNVVPINLNHQTANLTQKKHLRKNLHAKTSV